MEDQEDNLSSEPTGFDPLFIQEEDGEQERALEGERVQYNTTQPGITFTGTHLDHSAHIHPYLSEMDELLRSCEDLTGVPFGSHFSPSYTDLSGSTQGQLKREVMMDRYEKTSISAQPYLSTTYIDTRMDGTGTQSHQTQAQRQGMGSTMGSTMDTTRVPSQPEFSLTSAGTELSGTMVEYQSQLLGMLAMLESSMKEAGMDFDPQQWDTDTNQEYVQVRQNRSLGRATTLGSVDRGRTVILATQPAPLQSWVGQTMDGATAQGSMENKGGAMQGPTTQASSLSLQLGEENVRGKSGERLETSWNETGVCVDFKVDQEALEVQLRPSGSPIPRERHLNDSGHCERTNTGHMATCDESYTRRDMSRTDIAEMELPTEGRQDPEMRVAELGGYMEELGALGPKLEECIEEVRSLERRREELLEEVLELRGEAEERGEGEGMSEQKVAELMEMLKKEAEARREERQKEVQRLREERAEEEKRVWRINLERRGLQEETRRLRRRLFAAARDCTHSQAALTTQQREVEQFTKAQEQLQSLVAQLTEESSQLLTAHQQQISSLQAQLQAQGSSQTPTTQEELVQCRRRSVEDVQQYLQDGLKAVEDRYEPMLLALLKRKEAVAGAQVKAKEQIQELRAQLGPLREERQRLGLQRTCLEEKLKLMQIHRKEDVEQYKEIVYSLEESSRELKTELKIQKRKTKEMEELKDSLTKQLTLYRGTIEDQSKCDHEEKKLLLATI